MTAIATATALAPVSIPVDSPLRVNYNGFGRVLHSAVISTNYMINNGPGYSLHNENGFVLPTSVRYDIEIRDILGFVRQLVHKARLRDSGFTCISVSQNSIQIYGSAAVDHDYANQLVMAAIRTAGVPFVLV